MSRTALITGGSRGIGRAVALELASLGFDVVLSFVSAADAAASAVEACRQRQVRALAVQADISLAEHRQRLIDTLFREFGRIDLLVNNAGMAPLERRDLLETSEESYDRVMAVNLKGPFFLTQNIARQMIEAKRRDPSRRPKIVNISSISAYTSSVTRAEYCLSKAGVSMMTRLFADRLAEFDIPVYEIRPGIIRTDMTAAVAKKYDRLILQEGLTPIHRWGEPEDVAKAVAAVAQDLLPYCTGQVLDIDGGFHLRRL